MYRKSINKHQARASFNKKSSRTKGINLAPPPMRGGYRL